MKKPFFLFLILFLCYSINAQEFVNVQVHVRPDYFGGMGELQVKDCVDENYGDVVRTVTFDGELMTSEAITNIADNGMSKVLHYVATDGDLTYEFEMEIDFSAYNPTISYTILPDFPGVEPLSIIERKESANINCQGRVELIIAGGHLPISIHWYDDVQNEIGGMINQTILSNICAGNYGYTVAENYPFPCFEGIEDEMYIVDVPSIDCMVVLDQFESCPEACDGKALLFPIEGLGVGFLELYVYETGEFGTYEVNNVCGGYAIEGSFTDMTGATAQCFEIMPNMPVLDFELTTTDVTSPGNNDGSAEVVVTSGNPPYVYNWYGPNGYSESGTSFIENLEDGDYSLTINYGDNQCEYIVDFTIYDALGITIDDIEADEDNLSNGAVYFTITGGKPPYDTLLVDQMNNVMPGTNNLVWGDYTLTVKDAKDDYVSVEFNIPTMVSDLLNEKIGFVKIIPNPAEKWVEIVGNDISTVEIYDVNGKVVLKTTGNHPIDVSKIDCGMYLVHIEVEGKVHQEKLMVK